MGIEYGERRSTFIDYGRPSLFLDFARRKSLIDSMSETNLITFTRSTPGTYFGDDGLIKTASAHEPRFDHDPITGESLGLLIEGQRSNLVTYSEEFTNPLHWILSPARLMTSNSTVAPDGNTTADTMGVDSVGGTSSVYAYKSVTVSSGLTTFSGFFKKVPNKSDFIILETSQFDSTANGSSYFNVSTGELVSKSDNHISTFITKLNNEWNRFSITFNTSTDLTGLVIFRLSSDGTSSTITRDGSSAVYIWGAQLEQGSFPTSYIPTSGSTVTRQPDTAQITGTNFSSWYNPIESTLFLNATSLKGNLGFTGVQLSQDGDFYPLGLDISRKVDSSGIWFSIYRDYTNSIFEYGLSGSNNESAKVSLSISSTGSTMSVDGTLITPSLYSSRLGDMTTLGIGSLYNVQSMGGHISQFIYYPTRLTNTQLQELTQ